MGDVKDGRTRSEGGRRGEMKLEIYLAMWHVRAMISSSNFEGKVFKSSSQRHQHLPDLHDGGDSYLIALMYIEPLSLSEELQQIPLQAVDRVERSSGCRAPLSANAESEYSRLPHTYSTTRMSSCECSWSCHALHGFRSHASACHARPRYTLQLLEEQKSALSIVLTEAA